MDPTEPTATSRRSVLKAGLVVGAASIVPTTGLATNAAAAALPLPGDPFTLGVASGDPSPDGFVLWTRLALEPLAEDGRGGMPAREYGLGWQVATDPRFRRVVRQGRAVARPSYGHAVHVEVTGLEPGREYWYRFRQGRHLSRTGRALTSPHRGSMPRSLAMSFVSCSQFEHGWFTAYRRLAEDRPDLVLHLGDYQYEYRKDTYVAASGNVRDHEGPETVTLAGYRQRHAQYKSDPDLQEAHAVAPWLAVFDDHELDNNWADEVYEKPDIPQPDFLDRRAAAFRAYYENMPLRATSKPRGIDMQLYRRVSWGRLATFHMLDTRQYRDDQGCGDGYKTDCPAAVDPARSITGAEQEQWLSITSGGDGSDSVTGSHPWLAHNPHLRFQNNLRGYVNTTITPQAMEADFRCLPRVSQPGAEAFTRATFTLVDREPGLRLTRDNPSPAARTMRSPGLSAREIGDATVDWETARP